MTECSVCMEICTYQKYLKCAKDDSGINHAFCETCINKLKEVTDSPPFDSDYFIVCPLCGTSTTFDSTSDLKTKFFARLRCDDCHELKQINEEWWCHGCKKTVCGACAMRKHRRHMCNAWEDYELPRKCLEIFDIPSGIQDDNGDFEQEIRRFCQELQNSLLAKAQTIKLRAEFANKIKYGYGSFDNIAFEESNSPIEQLPDNLIHKMVQLTMDVLTSRDQTLCLDVEAITATLKTKPVQLKIPLITDILQHFEVSECIIAKPRLFDASPIHVMDSPPKSPSSDSSDEFRSICEYI